MKIIFMGTPDFAACSLDALINNGYDVCLVVTKPDKPVGRKQILTSSEVKVLAENHGLEVFQPIKMKDEETFNKISKFRPDLIVVVAYGKILPKSILDIPKFGCINVHGSLLPKYRGAAPIQQSIIDGKKITGVTTMFMDEGMDTGDMLLKDDIEIGENETAGELRIRLAKTGANLLIETIKKLETGKIKSEKQDDSKATYCSLIEKNMGKINWKFSADKIHNLIRGMNPSPVAFTSLNGKNFRIYLSRVCEFSSSLTVSGEILSTDPLIVACGEKTTLELLEVQLEGKKKMLAKDFARGLQFTEKIILGV